MDPHGKFDSIHQTSYLNKDYSIRLKNEFANLYNIWITNPEL